MTRHTDRRHVRVILQDINLISIFLVMLGVAACLFPYSQVHAEQPSADENVQTLEAIEVQGTQVKREKPSLTFPEPDITHLAPLYTGGLMTIPTELSLPHLFADKTVVLDKTGRLKGKPSPVKPIKAIQPLYPRFAREQGWQGLVVLRLVIASDGALSTATVQKSSGYPLLDDSALQSVRQWTFQPAQNGAFPVGTTVDLPIRFDLDQ